MSKSDKSSRKGMDVVIEAMKVELPQLHFQNGFLTFHYTLVVSPAVYGAKGLLPCCRYHNVYSVTQFPLCACSP